MFKENRIIGVTVGSFQTPGYGMLPSGNSSNAVYGAVPRPPQNSTAPTAGPQVGQVMTQPSTGNLYGTSTGVSAPMTGGRYTGVGISAEDYGNPNSLYGKAQKTYPNTPLIGVLDPGDSALYRGDNPVATTQIGVDAWNAGYSNPADYLKAMGQRNSAYTQLGLQTPTLEGSIHAAENAVEARYKAITDSGKPYDPAQKAADLQAARLNATAHFTAQQNDQQNAQLAQKNAEKNSNLASGETSTPGGTAGSGGGVGGNGGTTAGTPPVTPVKKIVPNATISHIASFLPPGSEYMAAGMQQSMADANNEATNAQTNADARTAAAKTVSDQVNTRLQSDMDLAKSTETTVQGNLQSSLDAQNKLAATNAAAEMYRQQDQEHSEIRQAATDLQKKMIDMNASIAATGGIGSSNAQAQLFAARDAGEKAVSDIKQKFGLQEIDTIAKYTDAVLKAHQDFTTKWNTSITDYQTKHDAIDALFNVNDEKYATELDKINQDLHTETITAMKDQTAAIKDATKNVHDTIKESNDTAATKKKNDQDNAQKLFDFAFTKSNDPSIRTAAVDAMNKAGLPIPSDFDKTAMTPDQYLKQMDIAQKGKTAAAINPMNFTDPQDQQIMSQAINAIGGAASVPQSFKDVQMQEVSDLLKAGKRDQAIAIVRGAVKASLTGKSAEEVPARDSIIQLSDTILHGLQGLYQSGANRGIYQSSWEGAQKWLTRSQDPSYLNLSSQLSEMEAGVLHATYGSRLTQVELDFAQKWIPNSKDTVLDALGKLRNLKDYMNSQNDAVLDAGMGGTAPTYSSSGSSPPTYDSNFYNSTIFGGGIPTKLDPPKVSAVLQKAGFTGQSLKTMSAIAMAESGGDPFAVGDRGIQTDTWGPSIGLAQIRSLRDPSKDPWRDASKLADPLFNAKAAFAKSNGGKDFSAWSTYTNGAYQKFLTS